MLPPGTGEDYDSDFSFQSEDENRPLTQTEMRERIVRGVWRFMAIWLRNTFHMFSGGVKGEQGHEIG